MSVIQLGLKSILAPLFPMYLRLRVITVCCHITMLLDRLRERGGVSDEEEYS